MENYSILVPSYTVGPEAYQKVPEFCKTYGRTAVVIGGEKAMAAAREKLLAATADSDLTILDFVRYGTECTFQTARELERHSSIQQADMIFAVGGGKAVDTAQ